MTKLKGIKHHRRFKGWTVTNAKTPLNIKNLGEFELDEYMNCLYIY